MNPTDFKTVYSSDPQVHLDIIKHARDSWKLVKEDIQSHDRIVLIFAQMGKNEK